MNRISELRKYVRIEKPYFAMLQIKANEDMISQDWEKVVLANLSAGGMSIYARKNIEVDTVLDVKIDFSNSHPDILCVGRVIRAKKHFDNSIIGFAIEFTEINEQIKEVINFKIAIASKQNWDNCKLFNTNGCPNIKDEFMKRFVYESSIGRRYLPTFDKRKETEVNERFAHNCDSFKPF